MRRHALVLAVASVLASQHAGAQNEALARADEALLLFEQACLSNPFDMSQVPTWARANGFSEVGPTGRVKGALATFERRSSPGAIMISLAQGHQCHVQVQGASGDRAVELLRRLATQGQATDVGVSLQVDRLLPGAAHSRQVAYLLRFAAKPRIGLLWGVIASPASAAGGAEVTFSTGVVKVDS